MGLSAILSFAFVGVATALSGATVVGGIFGAIGGYNQPYRFYDWWEIFRRL